MKRFGSVRLSSQNLIAATKVAVVEDVKSSSSFIHGTTNSNSLIPIHTHHVQATLREEHKAILAMLREMNTDARTPVTPLKTGIERIYLVAVGVPYRRKAEPPTYKVLERAIRPAIKSIGGKWIKTQGYEDYNPRTEERV